MAFEALSLDVNGITVKLLGKVAKEGPEVQANPALFGLALVPAGVLLVRGKEAEVRAGSVFTASVAEETPLPSSQ